MKRLLIFSLFIFLSCNQHKIEKQNSTIDSLRIALSDAKNDLNMKKNQVMIFYRTLNEIYEAMNRITRSEMILNNLNFDLEVSKNNNSKDMKQEILNMIKHIEYEFKKNEERFKSIRISTDTRYDELQKIVNRLYRTNREQQNQIADLTKVLNEKLEIIDNLKIKLGESQKEIQQKDIELAKRYYIIGKEDYLIDSKIIESAGGFLGINSKLRLCQPFQKYQFETLNNSETYIYVGAKIDELVPDRVGSYNIEGKGSSSRIKITNSDQFWQIRFLAIVIE